MLFFHLFPDYCTAVQKHFTLYILIFINLQFKYIHPHHIDNFINMKNVFIVDHRYTYIYILSNQMFVVLVWRGQTIHFRMRIINQITTQTKQTTDKQCSKKAFKSELETDMWHHCLKGIEWFYIWGILICLPAKCFMQRVMPLSCLCGKYKATSSSRLASCSI